MGDRYTYAPITVADDSSGRLHRFVAETDATTGRTRLLSDERCQKDQMGDVTALSEAEADEAIESADEARLCGHCFHRD